MTYSIGGRIRRLAVAGAAAAVAALALAGGALADAPANSGPFVIGDQNVAVGNQVYFWGAQWWQKNPLSTGLAPAAFKGFVDDNATATCGQDWTTDPGNSSHPPATLGDAVQAIVSSHITQTGSVISGDSTEVVEVQVDPGYAGNPGHPGTGTVVRIVCGGDSGNGWPPLI
jgi:hypothetical protein